MSQTTTLPTTRRTAHTRNILSLLRRPGRVYILTRDCGMIRVTKKEARIIVRGAGDDFNVGYVHGELVLTSRV